MLSEIDLRVSGFDLVMLSNFLLMVVSMVDHFKARLEKLRKSHETTTRKTDLYSDLAKINNSPPQNP